MIYGKHIETAGFDIFNKMSQVQFYAMLAYKIGGEDSLRDARKHLVQAIERIDAALVDAKDDAA